MSLTTDLGCVTAYADAVAQGYTGTREEFGEVLAHFADSATQVAKDKVVVEAAKKSVEEMQSDVSEKQQIASNAASSAESSAASAKGFKDEAQQFKESAKSSADSAASRVNGFDNHVADKISEANSAIETQQESSIQEVKNQTSAYINSEKATAKEEITEHTDIKVKELEKTISKATDQKTALEKTITNASDTEQGIVEAESARVEVEKKRVSAEQGRVDAESERVAAETARVQAETKRQQDTSKAITDCNTATDSALKAAATMMIVNDDTGKTYQGTIKVIGGKPVFEYDEVVTG